MDNSWITNALPFWILGIPLAIAVISYLRTPRQRDATAFDHRDSTAVTGSQPTRPTTAQR